MKVEVEVEVEGVLMAHRTKLPFQTWDHSELIDPSDLSRASSAVDADVAPVLRTMNCS